MPLKQQLLQTNEKQREHRADTRRRHGKDANTLTPENACVCIHANTLAVCNIGFHGRAEMSAPLI